MSSIAGVEASVVELLGRARAKKLRRFMEQTGLSQASLLRFGIDLVECHLAYGLPPKNREATKMGMARWGKLPPETRTMLAKRAVNARWAKYRQQKASASSSTTVDARADNDERPKDE